MFNKARFYERYRMFFSAHLSQLQVDGYEELFTAFDSFRQVQENPPAPLNDKLLLDRHLAYILASVYHETGTRMEPVREGFKNSDTDSIRYVSYMHRKGLISENYALPDAETGYSYFGRGFIQLTHKRNYLKAGQMLGLGDLFVWNPDLVLVPDFSAQITVFGMETGLFTGHQLFEYINTSGVDYLKARKVVNGRDRANIIKGYAVKFEKCIVE